MEYPNNNISKRSTIITKPYLKVDRLGRYYLVVDDDLLRFLCSQVIGNTHHRSFLSSKGEFDSLIITRINEKAFEFTHKRTENSCTICVLEVEKHTNLSLEVKRLRGAHYDF